MTAKQPSGDTPQNTRGRRERCLPKQRNILEQDVDDPVCAGRTETNTGRERERALVESMMDILRIDERRLGGSAAF